MIRKFGHSRGLRPKGLTLVLDAWYTSCSSCCTIPARALGLDNPRASSSSVLQVATMGTGRRCNTSTREHVEYATMTISVLNFHVCLSEYDLLRNP